MAADTIELILQAQQGDNSACERLISENSGLIWSIVRRFLGRGVEADDLYQLGSLGLIKAVRGFDVSFGTQFSTYAVPKISGEIRRFMRDDGLVKVSRSTKDLAYKINKVRSELEYKFSRDPTISEIAAELDISIEEVAMCENATAATDSLQRTIGDDGIPLERTIGDHGIEEKIIENVTLKEAIHDLPERERKVIYLRFYKGLTQERCARVLNISQVQVSRIERKAIASLRELIG